MKWDIAVAEDTLPYQEGFETGLAEGFAEVTAGRYLHALADAHREACLQAIFACCPHADLEPFRALLAPLDAEALDEALQALASSAATTEADLLDVLRRRLEQREQDAADSGGPNHRTHVVRYRESLEKAVLAGIELGRQRGLRTACLEVVSTRFPRGTSAPFRAALDPLDIDALKAALRVLVASRASTKAGLLRALRRKLREP